MVSLDSQSILALTPRFCQVHIVALHFAKWSLGSRDFVITSTRLLVDVVSRREQLGENVIKAKLW